jgi:hypothetical protein
LKLENHFADVNLFQPLLLYNLENLPLPPTTFYYHKTTNLLFVGLSNPSLSGKLSSIFSKITGVNTSSTKIENTPGVLQIYNIIKNHSGASHIELLYQKCLPSEVSFISFFEAKNLLTIGMNNGHISVLKVFINESNSISRDLVEEVCLIKAHKKKVVGAFINFSLGYVYSVARENSLKISEMNYASLMREIPISKKEISTMAFDEQWGRLFLTDDSGSIWILDMLTDPVNIYESYSFYLVTTKDNTSTTQSNS